MIRKYTLVQVRCDNCNEMYPSTKDVIYFQDEVSAMKTVLEEGWNIRLEDGKQKHYCPACKKAIEFVDEYFGRHGN